MKNYILMLTIIGTLFINQAVFCEISSPQKIPVTLKNYTFTAELATDSISRAQGLSNHVALNKHQAMLFIYPEPGIYNYWMPNMNYPLDILWFDQNKKLIYIKENLPPCKSRADCPIYGPATASQYVLEIPANLSKELQLQLGETINFAWDAKNARK